MGVLGGNHQKWLYLVFLALIWGSSFILIKKALLGLTALQVGGLRVVLAALTLLFIGFRSLRKLSGNDWKWLALAGLLSSFFPPFLFALAQTELDSGITAIFNATTPLLTTIVGIALFGALIAKRQIIGVVVGLIGVVALILTGMELVPDQHYGYAIFILLSALGYALNINIIKTKLAHLGPLAITTASFAVAVVPSFFLVLYSGFFQRIAERPEAVTAFWYVLILAIVGTALANIYFNRLIKVSSPVFAASVTYLIPVVAIFWGVLDGEAINGYQLLGGSIILCGVWLVNRKKT
ncbi:DMT family transporter [Maribacter sp. 2-571]|uniref:DMT family transporter n=1 Tax=Maribacter sp. 2-571 TaxID=3417569 RepID=UPI003D32831E